MFLQRCVSRRLQAVVFPLADREPQPKLQCRLEQRLWQLALPERIDDIDRLAEHELRNDVGSLTHAERGARGEAGDIDGNVSGGVAGADHEHALAAERVRALVGRGVDDLASERAWVLRYERFAVVAGADQQAVEGFSPCFAVRGDVNRPSAIVPESALLDMLTEADVRLKLKRSC